MQLASFSFLSKKKMLYTTIVIGLGLASYAQAHGNHEQQPIASDWASQHMADEHHISSYDAGSFFKLHDYDDSNEWTMEDIIKTYGGRDESTRHISQEDKDKAAKEVISLFDRDLSGTVSFAEFVTGDASGIKLPSISWATGHHGDDEFECMRSIHGPLDPV